MEESMLSTEERKKRMKSCDVCVKVVMQRYGGFNKKLTFSAICYFCPSLMIRRSPVQRIRGATRRYVCRFLTTVERHLKNVIYGIGFQVVIETIPPMMNALRMVWIVSKHYNTDEKVNCS